jgi:uncharacterized protein YgiM (DUF1202 family)
MRLVGLVLCCLAAWALASPPALAAEPRVALVIGNGAYKDAPLKNAVNDARAMAAALSRLGFDVIELRDAPRKWMESSILEFGDKLKKGGVGLFYYAGHGLQVKGQNYLVPVDANITSEASVRFEAIAVDSITDQMGDAANKANIVILDACRNNPFERRLRGGSRGLAAMDAARGTLIAYATAPGMTAEDGDGTNGVYTEELLKAVREPGLKVEDVFKRVRASVFDRTRGRQTPWESSSLTGDFYFNAATAVPAAPAAAATAPPGADPVEMAFWDAIKRSANPADYKAYLDTYPNGHFAALARVRAAAASPEPAASSPPPASPPAPQQQAAAVAPPPLQPAPQAAPPAAEPEIEPAEGAYMTLTRANVRAGPSADAPLLRALPADTPLTVTGKVKGANWYRVTDGRKLTGFVFGELVKDARVVEEAEWQGVKDSGDREALARFLRRFPTGPHAQAARSRETTLLDETRQRSAALSVAPPPAPPKPSVDDPRIGAAEARSLGAEAFGRRDYGAAVPWLRKAAEQGDVEAELLLAECYRMGWGVSTDMGAAMRWLRKAADQGSAEARQRLQQAAADGNDDAKAWLASQPGAAPAASGASSAAPTSSGSEPNGAAQWLPWQDHRHNNRRR